MKDITLVNSFFSPSNNEKHVPLGPLYLASVLEENGYNVDFRDYQLNTFKDPLNSDNFISFLKNSSNVIGISSMTEYLPFTILSIKKLKEIYPEKTVILGGPGPTGAIEKILNSFSFIDIVVKGEGEKTIVELMNHLDRGKNLREVCGISYRDRNKVYSNPPQKRIQNLDKVSFPAYHKVMTAKYSRFNIMSSRGCPYMCTFCDACVFWNHRNYVRSVDNVFNEIELIHNNYNIKKISFADDIFMLNKKRALDFCKKLKKIDIEWSCLGRIDLMDKELMLSMSNSGCKEIYYGIESGSDNVLKHIKKRFTFQKAGEVIFESHKYFDVTASFMWGFPFETISDFYETILSILLCGKIGVRSQLHLLWPTPLSQIYQDYKGDLEFSEEVCYDQLWHSYENRKEGKRNKKHQEIINLIKKYPEIFSVFYYIKSADIHKKIEILERFDLISNELVSRDIFVRSYGRNPKRLL